MSTTPTYTVQSPTSGTTYYAPSSFWFVPSSGTQIKVYVQAWDSSGNLLTVSSLTAIISDETSGSTPTSYTGSGDNTVDTIYSSPNGSDVYRPAGKVGQSGVAKITMYATYTGSAYSQPPSTPGNLSPASGSVVTTLAPTFSATFSDSTNGTTLSAYEIIVATSGGSTLWDSGTLTASTSEKNSGTATHSYGGSALSYGTTYEWKIRMENNNGQWGPYSTFATFTPTQGPNAPSSVAPNGTQTSLTPAWSYQYTSPSSVNQHSYRYLITSNAASGAPGATTVYDSGTVNDTVSSGATVAGTIPSGANLRYGAQYYFNIAVTDANGASSSMLAQTFSVAPQPTATPAAPINNQSVGSQTPALSWTYDDPNYAQKQYQVQVLNKGTGATLWDSGVVSSASGSITYGGSAIAFGTAIQWRVQVWDTAGIPSGWSAYASALVIDSPIASVSSPTNLGTITTAQPTVTWTYTPNSGSYTQASATISLQDSSGNVLGTWTQNGAGTSFQIPSGYLLNGQSYQVFVTVTDTNNDVGTSGTVTFTLAFPPPADMQGQPYASAVNYVVSPYLNTDANQNGVADAFTTSQDGDASVVYGIDTNVTQNVARADGSGLVTGAQKVTFQAGGTTISDVLVYSATGISGAAAGWTAGSTQLSARAMCMVQEGSASLLFARVRLEFYQGGTFLSGVNGPTTLYDTGGQFQLLLGPQGVTIPASCDTVYFELSVQQTATGDTGSVWWYGGQVEAATASDAHFIAGDLGTGYNFDTYGWSHRTAVAGLLPSTLANPGVDGDPLTAQGGTITLTWDTSLADATRFQSYLIERRRLDQQTDPTTWVTLATITTQSVGSYTDYTTSGNLAYQYGIRQQILYSDGSTGVSANRALAAGSVDFSPAWYLCNSPSFDPNQNTSGAAPIYNFRLMSVGTKRTFAWDENAVYTQFLGRVGQARDAGPDAGYKFSLPCYFDATFGDDLVGVRRALVQMQRLSCLWYLKDPEGLAVPCYLTGIKGSWQDTWSDTLMEVDFEFLQAADISDY